jgi:hypothetical protein
MTSKARNISSGNRVAAMWERGIPVFSQTRALSGADKLQHHAFLLHSPHVATPFYTSTGLPLGHHPIAAEHLCRFANPKFSCFAGPKLPCFASPKLLRLAAVLSCCSHPSIACLSRLAFTAPLVQKCPSTIASQLEPYHALVVKLFSSSWLPSLLAYL